MIRTALVTENLLDLIGESLIYKKCTVVLKKKKEKKKKDPRYDDAS